MQGFIRSFLAASKTLLATLLAALPVACATAATAAGQVVPDTMAQRLKACTACHGDAAAPPAMDAGQARRGDDRRADDRRYFPRIAGKPSGYLYNQLRNFRDGRRQYPLMTWMVDHLSDDYLREIADYFSHQHLAAPVLDRAALPAAQLARGRQLVTRGDDALKVPACIACHGARLTGRLPAIPGLVGLPRDYINAQFGAWRTGTRRAHAPDCMATIANRLSLDDVAAVSAWLASEPQPPDPSPDSYPDARPEARPESRPAADGARPLPLACGSALVRP